jgi:hypothetical protein
MEKGVRETRHELTLLSLQQGKLSMKPLIPSSCRSI